MEVGDELNLGDERTADVLRASHGSSVMTTSLGRLLDALSALLLGVTWRSYDGEPAMRLETLLSDSADPLTEIFRIPVKKGMVDVRNRWKILLDRIIENRSGILRPGLDIPWKLRSDLAMGFVGAVMDDLVESALLSEGPIDAKGRKLMGISGGVAYNVPITKWFIKACRKAGAVPVLHSRVPPGDGGISIGQAYIGGLLLEEDL
jgi:hydrogenase maturation protein HypF